MPRIEKRKVYLVVNQNQELMSEANYAYSNIALRGYTFYENDVIDWANEVWGPDSVIVFDGERQETKIETIQDAVNACRRGGWMVLTQIDTTT